MHPTPIEGVRAVRFTPAPDRPNRVTGELPPHLVEWQLPDNWRWGSEGVQMEHRHYQEIIDALGRSLSLVSAPDPEHTAWLGSEARHLAHRNHPSIPTTYHYWTQHTDSRRGPGYLRRWISAETVGGRIRRLGPEDIPFALRVLRAVGSTVSYLHDTGMVHGAISPEILWAAPTGRLWMLGWQWAVPRADIPAGMTPDRRWTCWPPEWAERGWAPTVISDQWQLAASVFAVLTGELPPPNDVPPVQWLRPECPISLAAVIDKALRADPEERYPSVSSMLRSLERGSGTRPVTVTVPHLPGEQTDEARLRWAVADDYDVLGFLGRGTFGSVWRVRDLSLEREVALKMLHPEVAQDQQAVGRFRREARLAAQLAHPAIIPIFDWDARGDVSWYTMELAEGGSVCDLVARSGPRPFDEAAAQIEAVLEALVAAHGSGIMHRDLKPENILIDRYRRWRITDFGIARAEDEPGGTTGTPAFAAPEQLLGEAQGPAVDCFAIAGIVAFVLSGSPPFEGRDAQTILAQQLSGRFDASPFEEPLAEWLRTGLAADPAQRFPDASVMLEAWRDLVASYQGEERRQASWWSRVLGG